MTNSKKITQCAFHYDFKQVSAEGEFEGYGSLFDNEKDSYGDIIAKGCFSRTLQEGGRNKNGVAMLYQHDPKLIPGAWTSIEEDSLGLRVKGKLANTQLGKECHELLKLGALKGLSIGYNPVRWEIDEEKDCRTLKEVDLWEISLVTFPAKIPATITSVKQIEEARTERDLENVLRESGLSKSASQYLVKLCKGNLRESNSLGDSKEEKAKKILETIRSAKKEFLNF